MADQFSTSSTPPSLPGAPLAPASPVNEPSNQQPEATVGEVTNKQAMQFQPSNAAQLGGIVGIGGGTGWDSWQNSGIPLDPNSPSPGMISNYTINGLPIAWPGAYAWYRKILADPSVRYVRAIAYSPILASKWNVRASKNAPKEAAEMIQGMLEPIRGQFLDDAVRALDYGWAGFEQVYQMIDGVFTLCNLKALMHDLTSIYVDQHGNHTGFNNNSVQIDGGKCLLYTYDGESGNLYGRGRCQNLLEIVPWWRDANDGAARYDRKIAGVFMVCHYPPGSSVDRNGQILPNYKIAQDMLNAVAAGKPIAVCNEFAGEVMDGFLNNMSVADRTRWKLEMLEDKGSRQPGFTERLVYLDKLKARAMLLGERSAFEAQKSGSRADSESHGDNTLIQGALIADQLACCINGSKYRLTSPINNILRMNWGDSAIGTVWVVPTAIEDDKKKFIRDLAREVISGYPVLLGEASDISEIFEQAGLPLPSEPVSNDDILQTMEDTDAKGLKVSADNDPQAVQKGGRMSRFIPTPNGHS